jgi:hypothetical protein
VRYPLIRANHGTYTYVPVLGPVSADTVANPEQPDAPPAWNPITLHAGVLRQLQDWNKNCKDSDRLPNVLNRVRTKVATALDSKGIQIAFDIIPNAPVPIGNIVKGLAWLIVIGLVCPWLHFWVNFI